MWKARPLRRPGRLTTAASSLTRSCSSTARSSRINPATFRNIKPRPRTSSGSLPTRPRRRRRRPSTQPPSIRRHQRVHRSLSLRECLREPKAVHDLDPGPCARSPRRGWRAVDLDPALSSTTRSTLWGGGRACRKRPVGRPTSARHSHGNPLPPGGSAREATGVVAAITPWNVPHQINLAELGPASRPATPSCSSPPPTRRGAPPYSAGSSPRRPTSRRRGQRAHRRRTPDRAGLTTDPRVDLIFTGSTATGRAVIATAARRSRRSSSTRRQVGLVVLDDADVRGRVRPPAFTVCIHAGQGCAITTRLLVPRARFDEAVDIAAASAGELTGRRPHRPGHHLRPAHRARQRDRVETTWPGPRGGRPVRWRRRAPSRGGHGVTSSSRPSSSGCTTVPGWPARNLRTRAGHPPPRRGQRRGGARQRLALRAVGLGVVGATATGPCRGRRGSVPARSASTAACGTPRRALRRVQAVRCRARDGRGRSRGVPRDQGGGPEAGMKTGRW